MAKHLVPCAAIVAAVVLLMPRATGYPWPFCHDSDNFKANSSYQAHLNFAAATLPKNASASPDLFATTVVGTVPEQLWAVGLCRGDVNATACFNCLTQSFQDLQNDCSYDKGGTIYYDPCMLHYSDSQQLLADDESDLPYFISYNGNVTSDQARFNRLVAELVNATAEYAAYNSTRRFATGESSAGFEPKVYSLAQCTPDLTAARCRTCLAAIISQSLDGFQNLVGGRALWINCTYRYETAPFFDGPALVQIAPPPSSGAPAPAPAPTVAPATQPTSGTPAAVAGGGGRKYSLPSVVVAAVLTAVTALNLVACLCLWRRRRQTAEEKQTYPMYSTEAEDTEMVDSMMMDASVLRAATGDFDESNKLGEGGFGAVYKGVLPDGGEVAVKRLTQGRSTRGVEELKNELALVAKLRHKNVVTLVGICLEQQERLLVYEFVANRSLNLIIFDAEKRERLDWRHRHQIINGIARGLQYLHEDSQLKVVHRDLNPSNILLDANMDPKISGFGLARIVGRDQTQAVVSQGVVGTYGYMAPEYALRGNYSVKSDAFSFGVTVLEIITGRRNASYGSGRSDDLLDTVWQHWEAGTVMETVDPCMDGSFPEGDVLRCIHVALLCVQGDPAARPLMSSVVVMLGGGGGDTITLQAPSKPMIFGFSHESPENE